MAGCSDLRNEMIHDLHNNEISLDIDNFIEDHVDGGNNLQVLFYQVLSVFVKEASRNERTTPIPVMLGDGRSMDLFKLFCAVKEKGGYAMVSEKGLWGSVVEECGLDAGVSPCVKLIYFKYLEQLDQWLLRIFQGRSSGKGEGEYGGNLGPLMGELEAEFRELVLGGKSQEEKDDEVDVAHGGRRNSNSRKRRLESFSRMLSWLREIAMNPQNLAMGITPKCDTGKKHKDEQFFVQALRIRELLFTIGDINEERSLSEQNQNVQNLLESNTMTDAKDLYQSSIPLGPQFQAEVPEWTGVITESDLKWLGTKIWSPTDEESYCPVGRGKQGSCDCHLPGSIECVRFHIAEKRMDMKHELGLVFYRWGFDGMGEEVSLAWTAEEEKRFENTMQSNTLSQTLSQRASFWNEALKHFPNKTKEELISYYFNVFLIKRRSYQNRATPEKIDNEDNESEFGSPTGTADEEADSVSGA